MSAMKLSNSENVQEYTSKIQSYVNDFNLCADNDSLTATGMMPQSERTHYLMKRVPKNDDWRVFTQLRYDKIDTLADTPEVVIAKMNIQAARSQKDDDSKVAAMLLMLHMDNKMWNSKHSRKSHKSRGGGCKSDGSGFESEKHRHSNWTDTQECYRCHQVGRIARYYRSTAPVESTAPT
jgi:hypothetical protein